MITRVRSGSRRPEGFIIALCWPLLSGLLTLWLISTLPESPAARRADPGMEWVSRDRAAHTPHTAERVTTPMSAVSSAEHLPLRQDAGTATLSAEELATVIKAAAQDGLSPDMRLELATTIHALAALPEGTDLLATLFFDEDDSVSMTLYRLIVHSNLRSTNLLEQLVQHAVAHQPDNRHLNLIDLIGDFRANAPDNWQPPAELLAYLQSLGTVSDPGIQSAALRQWIWLSPDDEALVAATDTYLTHPDPAVRQEWFDRMLAWPPGNPMTRAQIRLRLQETLSLDPTYLTEGERRIVRRLEYVLSSD